MGSHLNHMIFTLPIFWEGELVGVQLVDGALAGRRRRARRGRPRDIYEEGLQMPIVKIYRAGRVRRRAGGDHPDQRAASRTWPWATSARRSRRSRPASGASCSCCSATARDAVLGSIAAIYRPQRASWRAQAVRAIPDGVYEAESFMDDDGVRLGQRIPIQVKGRRSRATR